jgi:copper homeostasis protein
LGFGLVGGAYVPGVLLEICVASVEDAVNAAVGGADRLELNAALSLGGLTPSLGTLIEIKQRVVLPVMVMVRPRSGGFCYDEADFAVMRRDVDLFLAHGADGIVFGVLHQDGSVDQSRCEQLLQQAGKVETVFHRAFDVTPEPLAALGQLMTLGFRRVMTSGQQESAYNGAVLIAELICQSAGRIEVLPAGGINRFTVADVVARTKCQQVHASLRRSVVDQSTSRRPQVSFGGALRPQEDRYDATNREAVSELRELVKG